MKKILVIDDDEEIVYLVKNRLEASNYDVMTAYNGLEGLEKIRHDAPNLIVLDIAMPAMDGYTFVLELRKIDGFRTIPVIMLTAKDKMQPLFAAEGIRHYLIKPFIAEDLLKKMEEILTD